MKNGAVIGLNEAIAKIPRHPGLVIGSEATIGHGQLDHLKPKISKLLSDANRERAKSAANVNVLIDIARTESPELAEECERLYRDAILQLEPSLELSHIVRAPWRAVLSLTLDLAFETKARNHLEQVATSRTLTVIDSPAMTPPPRSTNDYKLLGNIMAAESRPRPAYGLSDVTARESVWPALTRAFVDDVRSAPILLLGTQSDLDITRRVLALLFGSESPRPGHAIFLMDDPALNDPTIVALLSRSTRYEVVDASLRDFCNAVADMKPAQAGLELRPSTDSDSARKALESDLSEYSSYVSLVPDLSATKIDINLHRPSLVDALFRPLSVDWSPYAANLDLKRDATGELIDTVEDVIEAFQVSTPKSVILRGESAVGKTIVLKRSAAELARRGFVTLWCRRSPTDSWFGQYRKIALRLREYVQKHSEEHPRIVVFCDDPWAARLSAPELIGAFELASCPATFIFGLRNSDYLFSDSVAKSIQTDAVREVEVSDKLSETELTDLQRMLLEIGAAANTKEAAAMIARVPQDSHANDVLCSLWYLVPETRSQITASLQDEYARLGSVDTSIEGVAAAATQTGNAARLAYEFVTVTSNLDLGIPMEVLVHAIGIDYPDWVEMCRGGRPVWGLIYGDEDPEAETIIYRTRNDVVTRVLLRLVNGGMGHAGEFARLKQLVKACSGGTLVYRNFLVDLLAASRKKLQDCLSYAQGLELYELAEATLPHPDRILAHHKGLWMQHVGRDSSAAYSQLERALNTPSYPGASREEPREFIHTSMAATVVQEIRAGKQDRKTGLETVKMHLQQAMHLNRFDPYMTHVFANNLFEIAKRSVDDPEGDSVTLSSLAEAFHEIEIALQTIGACGSASRRYHQDVEMLTALQRSIFDALPEIEALEAGATALLENSRSQIGFEVSARRRFLHASSIDKGKTYFDAFEHIARYFNAIQEASLQPSVGLRAVRADLVIRWRLQRTAGQVDWGLLKDDLEAVLASPRYRDDVIKSFYLGVALYHLGEIGNANAVFHRLRRDSQPKMMPSEIRAYYCSKEGSAARVQGEVRRHHGNMYVVFAELNTEILLSRHADTLAPGSIGHFYIGFALNGPIAVTDNSRRDELRLPSMNLGTS